MPRKSPPPDESKEQRFERMVNARVTATLEKVRLIENLSNKSVYKYSDDQIEKIFQSLKDRLMEARAKFKKNKREEFKL